MFFLLADTVISIVFKIFNNIVQYAHEVIRLINIANTPQTTNAFVFVPNTSDPFWYTHYSVLKRQKCHSVLTKVGGD